MAALVVGFLAAAGGMPRSAAAQSDGGVTFSLPLNLTQLPPDIGKIVVWCQINSSAINNRNGYISKQEEYVPSGGQVVTTATIVVPTTDLLDPIGKQAAYTCVLSGFSNSLQKWDTFREDHPTPVFRLKPTPADMKGTFTW